MGQEPEAIPIAPNELLMRRVPASVPFFQPNRPPESPLGPTLLAFKPTKEDTTGISLSRMKSDTRPDFLAIDAFAARACRGKPPQKHFYVALLLAERLMAVPLSLELKADPIDQDEDRDPGHILIPKLHTNIDKETRDSLTLTLGANTVFALWGLLIVMAACLQPSLTGLDKRCNANPQTILKCFTSKQNQYGSWPTNKRVLAMNSPRWLPSHRIGTLPARCALRRITTANTHR